MRSVSNFQQSSRQLATMLSQLAVPPTGIDIRWIRNLKSIQQELLFLKAHFDPQQVDEMTTKMTAGLTGSAKASWDHLEQLNQTLVVTFLSFNQTLQSLDATPAAVTGPTLTTVETLFIH